MLDCARAIVAHTRQAFTLDDYTVARITRDEIRTTTLDNVVVTPQVRELEVDLEQIELGNFDHYMIKEIYEQPEALRRSLQGRLDLRDGKVVLGGILEFARELATAKRIVFVGQGTALHAAMIGEYLVEQIAKIPAEVEDVQHVEENMSLTMMKKQSLCTLPCTPVS